MFKYSLFICKCSERESHFDCHIDCHFDCNLQLIVNFLSDNMSELKGVRSGAERMKKYRAENKQKCDLTNLKQNFRRSQLLGSGTPEGEKMRKAAAERKTLQRLFWMMTTMILTNKCHFLKVQRSWIGKSVCM